MDGDDGCKVDAIPNFEQWTGFEPARMGTFGPKANGASVVKFLPSLALCVNIRHGHCYAHHRLFKVPW
ncbi:hypothetical protein E2C01_087090 [Portunus trituberculatus]|uniref:Uncharacterized protein n=1 Tax=Portunus trituberculatus TaxID=210409 RepID=A0A5B7J2G7_PORTR|nr:hypothetical protein [Portunus trituberculatus]